MDRVDQPDGIGSGKDAGSGWQIIMPDSIAGKNESVRVISKPFDRYVRNVDTIKDILQTILLSVARDFYVKNTNLYQRGTVSSRDGLI